MKKLILVSLLLIGCARQPSPVVDHCPPCLADEIPVVELSVASGAVKCVCEKSAGRD